MPIKKTDPSTTPTDPIRSYLQNLSARPLLVISDRHLDMTRAVREAWPMVAGIRGACRRIHNVPLALPSQDHTRLRTAPDRISGAVAL